MSDGKQTGGLPACSELSSRRSYAAALSLLGQCLLLGALELFLTE